MSYRVIHRCEAFASEAEAKAYIKRQGYGLMLRPKGKTKLEHDCACSDNNYPMSSFVVTWNETVES